MSEIVFNIDLSQPKTYAMIALYVVGLIAVTYVVASIASINNETTKIRKLLEKSAPTDNQETKR